MGKKGRKHLQTNLRIFKTAHLACHAWVHAPTFDAVISCHKLTNKNNVWPSIEQKWTLEDMCGTNTKFLNLSKFFSKQCTDGRNGQIIVNLNDQCRFCHCSFKVKFVNLRQRSYISTQNLFNWSKSLQGWNFSSKPPESWIWGGKMWHEVFKSRIFNLWGGRGAKSKLS